MGIAAGIWGALSKSKSIFSCTGPSFVLESCCCGTLIIPINNSLTNR